jgi:hypothetical protein
MLPLLAATYFMVSGGPYGLKEITGDSGYGRTLLVLFALPFFWSLPTALLIGGSAAAALRCERRRGRAGRLRPKNDRFAAETIGQMTCREGKRDDRDRRDETDQAKRGGGVRSGVNFPFDRDRQHLAADDRDEVAENVGGVAAKAKSRVGIARRRRIIERGKGADGFRSGIVARGKSARAQEIVKSGGSVATGFRLFEATLAYSRGGEIKRG